MKTTIDRSASRSQHWIEHSEVDMEMIVHTDDTLDSAMTSITHESASQGSEMVRCPWRQHTTLSISRAATILQE